MEITVKTKFRDIYKRPEFRSDKRALHIMDGLTDGVISMLSIQRLAKIMKVWNGESMAEGFQHLSDRAKEQRVFYDFYSEEERRKDPSKEQTKLIAFPVPQGEKQSKCAFICAGGGYRSVCTCVEAFPIAKRLNELGISAFVVKYRYGKNATAPNPMEDLSRAVRFVADHAGDFHVDMEDYCVMGFSAGGHVAASYCASSLGFCEMKPATAILCYPVISMENHFHKGSRDALLGKQPSSEAIGKYSVERQVDENYPATFIWQFRNDNTVSIENSKAMVAALKKNYVNHMYKTYPGTLHGVGDGRNTAASGWIDEAVAFWKAELR